MERRSVLTVDVGSTTTKSILFVRDGMRYRVAGLATAPTTVEGARPDVMAGFRESLRRLERRAGRRLLDADGGVLRPERDGEGVDALFVTSSAAGGLVMAAAGVVRKLTAESAERAALGSGAIVGEILALDDDRSHLERIEALRRLQPDLILIAGGTDQANPSSVLRIVEIVAAARTRARGGQSLVPVVFAGNVQARPMVQRILGEIPVEFADNIRPTLEEERTGAPGEVIHRLFLEHVMAHAPGYDELAALAGREIEPTPRAAGRMVEALGASGRNVLAFDIGGATTDVFSCVRGVFHRSVSAHAGMSYNAVHVLGMAGEEAVRRWLPFEPAPGALRRWALNKTAHPTTIPETEEEIAFEQALAREALRLAWEQHMRIAVTLRGVHHERGYTLDQSELTGVPLLQPNTVDVLVGSGGVLSHAPSPGQALAMLLDGVPLAGVFEAYVDQEFLMPHLGGLARHDADAALATWPAEGLRFLGTCVVPAGSFRPGTPLLRLEVPAGGGEAAGHVLRAGEVLRVPLPEGGPVRVRILPRRGLDMGAGPGRPREIEARGGEVGLVADGRGRPVPPGLQKPAAVRRWLELVGGLPGLAGGGAGAVGGAVGSAAPERGGAWA
ncbi:MAG: glutamate mutase L [Firmicutes bacterium]|nr:glutamate mutase L [Bacillota bacterium]